MLCPTVSSVPKGLFQSTSPCHPKVISCLHGSRVLLTGFLLLPYSNYLPLTRLTVNWEIPCLTGFFSPERQEAATPGHSNLPPPPAPAWTPECRQPHASTHLPRHWPHRSTVRFEHTLLHLSHPGCTLLFSSSRSPLHSPSHTGYFHSRSEVCPTSPRLSLHLQPQLHRVPTFLRGPATAVSFSWQRLVWGQPLSSPVGSSALTPETVFTSLSPECSAYSLPSG